MDWLSNLSIRKVKLANFCSMLRLERGLGSISGGVEKNCPRG